MRKTKLIQLAAEIEISSWEVLTYGIFARVNWVSQSERSSEICLFYRNTYFLFNGLPLPNVNSAHLNVKKQAKNTLLTKPKTKLLRHRT